MIEIFRDFKIPDSHLRVTFSTSPGAGGQHVNRTQTQVTLFYDVNQAPEHYREKLLKRVQINNRCELVVRSNKWRSQRQNITDAYTKLENSLKSSLAERKKRKPTKPTKGSKEKRLKQKQQRGELKKMRKAVD